MPALTRKKRNNHQSSVSQQKSTRKTSFRKISSKILPDTSHVDHHAQNRIHIQRPTTKVNKTRSKSHRKAECSGCQTLSLKLNEQEQHFRQLVLVHQWQVKNLEENIVGLRNELSMLETRAETAETQLDLLKDQASCSIHNQQIDNNYQMASLSPIGQPRGLALIKKLTQVGERSTFAELLIATPQPSQLGSDPFQAGQKQQALKSQFDRLMQQCSITTNRSKKASLRKQLAAIAQQLNSFGIHPEHQ